MLESLLPYFAGIYFKLKAMITNFEDRTKELNEYELDTLLPIVVKGLNTKQGKDKAITNSAICKALKAMGYKISDVRLRKIIHYIRANNIIPLLLATSRGYYVSNDSIEISDYIKSLDERINSITTVRDSLHYQLNR